MAIDLTKIGPAPMKCHVMWIPETRNAPYGPSRETHDEARADADFFEMSRNALDVMMRRGWYPLLRCRVPGTGEQRWVVCNDAGHAVVPQTGCFWQGDPYTALVEAEAWYVANVEEVKHGV